MGLDYRALYVEAAKQGIEKIVWDRMWRDKFDKAMGNLLNRHEDIGHEVVDFLLYRHPFAITYVDILLIKHIEGNVGWRLRNKYKDLNVFCHDGNHIGTSCHRYNMILEVNLPAGTYREIELLL